MFDELARIPDMKDPTFVFAHVFITHGPYLFDRNGRPLTNEETNKRSRTISYVDSVIFTNKKIKTLVNKLLLDSEVPPIIILQADEGPYPERHRLDPDNFNWKQASSTELKEKMAILNAYYLPGIEQRVLRDVLYPSITPVNSFRLVFNLYFDTDFELLPDKSYAYTDKDHIYDFFDITDKLD